MIRRPAQTQKHIKVIDFEACPAKTFLTDRGASVPGRTVFNHCQIVGEVAKELIARLPKRIQTLFPKGSPMAAAGHDVGKVCPTFYNKLMNACSLEMLPGVNYQLDREWGGHAGVSQATAKSLGAPQYVPEILGSSPRSWGCFHAGDSLMIKVKVS